MLKIFDMCAKLHQDLVLYDEEYRDTVNQPVAKALLAQILIMSK